MNALKNIISIVLFCLLAHQFVFAQSSTCMDAEPFCTNAGVDFPNITGGITAEVGPDYGCLQDPFQPQPPRPAWFFLKIENSGDLFMLIEQNSAADFTGTGIDVDFVAWGPFTEAEFQAGVCGSLTTANIVPGQDDEDPATPPNTTTSQGCSYSPSPVENFNIIGANAGEYFVLMVTNFFGSPGFIRMNITTGVGSTDCSILESTLGPDQNVCEGDNVVLDATPIQGIATSYVWSLDTGSGFNVLVGETNATLNPTVSGIYQVEVTDSSNNVVIDDVVIIFNTVPIANQPSDILVCDDVSNDGIENFDFAAQQDTSILNGQDPTLYTITYHETMADAQANTAILTMPYTSVAGSYPKTIYARIENNNNTSCFNITSFEIEVFEIPIPMDSLNIATISNCDNTSVGTDIDGYALFNLENQETTILNGQSATDFTLTYFTDLGYTNGIATPSAFSNTIANGQTIYVRMSNNSNTNCYTDTSFDIEILALPVVATTVDLRQCDDDADGISLFNLTEANTLISVNAVNETITYYLTQAEADTGLAANQIANITNYPNPVPLASIVFARIEATNGCFRTTQINLIVSATQIPAAFNLNYNVCDDYLVDNDNTNGVAAFDFSNATAQILGQFPPGQNLTVTYYTNVTDALAEFNAIADISNYRNDISPNAQNIVVRVDSDAINACLGLGEHITLTVDAVPFNNVISDYELCSDTNQASFDLTAIDTEVIGTQTQDFIITYHESLSDAENNISAFVSPYPNQTNPQTIYVRAQFDDNSNGIGDFGECVSTDMSFELIVIPNPILFQPEDIQICNEQVNTVYDLTVRFDEITGGDTSIVLTYFESQLDLDSNNPIPVPTFYLNTLFDREILVLATGANSCTSTITMSLKTILYENFNLFPTIIEECEVDNDGFDNFDLTRREDEILNGLDPLDFSFVYYELEADAVAGNNNSISDPTTFINTQAVAQTIYVRVKPIVNECFRVIPLTLIVNPVPEIAIDDEYVICLASNGSPITPFLNTFLPNPPIDTQLSTIDFTFQWYQGSEALPQNIILGATESYYDPVEAGYYTIIATDVIKGCTIPATTLVIGSYPPQSITVEVLTDAFSSNDILEVNVTGIGEYEYSLDNGAWQESPRFEGVSGGEHTIYVRDIYNCNEITTIKIVIDYPRFFTPNGDGYNNSWNIVGIADQLSAKIFIYDRYGKLIKQLNPIGPGWDGTFNGDYLPSSDYWFTVEYTEPRDGTIRQFKSHFSLKR